ncbi:hypothetical protein NAEGRDRAFT_68117 [Naegleria gruberi]|uniref:Dynein regulatory complex subunit 7 n=1 Tax=Naegleria gruberi TaxID=5762 RepID=D2VGW2_NAEGR|nr:uncharacterized protein NAEGRDRAFT_68117 [Naegleria gruberi]EFC44036.1 hypothetical protein NAEGRDRAFT_68117 [Naegleria gruberi]|eukprot:XP_002676780.1 hypothetical protein NAEGRDRAFT_68117 [Naegleria gruberi strain NEG-M]
MAPSSLDLGIEWHAMDRAQRLAQIYELYEKAQKEKLNTLESKLANSSEPLEYRVSEDKPIELDRVISFVPDSYRSNENREDVILEFVENFNLQYSQLFKDRKPLILYPENEVGIHKFICTYIKPTLLPYPDLYDAKGIAQFIHHHTTFESLDRPFEIPEVVCSPTTTLYWQKGNSFDLSTLLVSLLIGAGFNAYCVSGYAKKSIVLNDQTQSNSPIEIEPEEEEITEEQRVFKPSKYKLKTRPNLTSHFRREDYPLKEDIDIIESKVSEVLGEDIESEQEKIQQNIGKILNYVHCWVAVLPGRRDVKAPFFIEPSSGQVFELNEIDEAGYYGIESLWNHENYWCNISFEKKISEIVFDLKNLRHWEYVFIQHSKESEIEDEDENAQEEKRIEFLTVDEGEYDDDVLDVPSSWVGRISIAKRKYEDRYPLNYKLVEYANTTIEYFSPYFRSDLVTKIITCFHDEMKEKTKEIHYYYSNRKDLLRRRSVYYIYSSADSDVPIRERIHEWFDPGRKTTSNFEALKEFVFEKGVRREYKFYSEARLDGLEKRTELFESKNLIQPKKVIEYFHNRIDFGDYLCYRSVTYDIDKSSAGLLSQDHPEDDKYGPIIGDLGSTQNNNSNGLSGSMIDFSNTTDKSFTDGALTRRKQLNDNIIIKMTEKFLRDESRNANEDVAKRTFYIVDKKIRLEYHYGEGKITRSVREYTKDGQFYTEIIDPFMPRPKLVDTVEEYHALLQTEVKCKEDIIKSTAEMANILQTRYSEEKNIQFTTTIYDVERNRPTEEELRLLREKERELEEQRKNKDLVDHLIPKDGVKSVQQAEEIYYTVMKDLKDQLMMRINIIEERLQKEKQKLARRRTMYQKSQEGVDRNSEEYVQFCQDTLFKIKILKQRAEDHNARAAKKFAELKEKLLNHKQLGGFLKHLKNKKN